MRRSRRLVRQSLSLDLTPMVDVVFLLIIFFMVSTTFITLESGLPVDLPDAQTSQTQASDLPTVTIAADESVYLAGVAIAEVDLVGSLRSLLDAGGGKVVILRADSSVSHGLTVRVMDLIRQSGAERIAIATGG
jgi:biopolymer transport protein ExbD